MLSSKWALHPSHASPHLRASFSVSPSPPQVADIIFRSLNLQLAAGSSGADEFLPVLVYVVLQTKLPRICSHLAYIEAYRHPGALAGRAGYLLVSLQSAIAFIESAVVASYRAAP